MKNHELGYLAKVVFENSKNGKIVKADSLGNRVNKRFGLGTLGKYWNFFSGTLVVNEKYKWFEIFWAPRFRRSYIVKVDFIGRVEEVRREESYKSGVHSEYIFGAKELDTLDLVTEKFGKLFRKLPTLLLLTSEDPFLRKMAKKYRRRQKWSFRLKNFLRISIQKFVSVRK